jgi:D-glucosaminate-6-phosphate ammonia-lyase
MTTTGINPYERLGVAPVINACGIYTDLGGSCLSESVWLQLALVNRTWASVPDLLDATGARIAQLVGTEAARVTPGASAAIMLGVAACLSGGDPELNERLPGGPPHQRQVVMQRAHRYKYTRVALLAGADIVEAGDDGGTSGAQLEAALAGGGAAILHPAHLDGRNGSIPLAEVASIAHAWGVPIVVDAAYLSFPTQMLTTFTRDGADLVCFSAKYFWGPNAGGFIAGRKELIQAVADLDFTHYEGGPVRTFGRPLKLDRTTIVATLLALEEWLAMDHDERWQSYRRRVDALVDALSDLPGVRSTAKQFTLDERLTDEAPNALVVTVNGTDAAAELEHELAAGAPRILCSRIDDSLVFAVETIEPDQDGLVARRIRELATARP